MQALVGSSGDKQEGELLTYLVDFKSALQVMTTVKLLSSHADDEHTLNEPNAMLTVSRPTQQPATAAAAAARAALVVRSCCQGVLLVSASKSAFCTCSQGA
jgi:hypothetical protein